MNYLLMDYVNELRWAPSTISMQELRGQRGHQRHCTELSKCDQSGRSGAARY
jgi:hypothetical protein